MLPKTPRTVGNCLRAYQQFPAKSRAGLGFSDPELHCVLCTYNPERHETHLHRRRALQNVQLFICYRRWKLKPRPFIKNQQHNGKSNRLQGQGSRVGGGGERDCH